MFRTPSRIATVTLAAASIVGSGLSIDPASAAAPNGGVSVEDSLSAKVQGPAGPEATQTSAGPAFDVAAVAAAIDASARGSIGYAFRISQGGQPVGGGAGGHARRPLDGTQDHVGTAFTVDTRIEVQLPAVQHLLPAGKGAKARRALAKVNARVLSPAGVKATRCKGGSGDTAAHVYNARNLAIGGTLVGAAGNGECGPRRGLLLSATDLVRLAPSLELTAAGGTRGGWTTAAGQSDDGQVTWQSGDGEFPGGREIHTCLASAGGHDFSIIFNAQTPGDQSPCRILLDAINASRTAS